IRKVSFKAIRPTAELATHDVHDTFILVGDKEFRVVQSYTSAKKNFQQQQQLQQSISEDSATLSQASALNYTVKVLKCIENSKFSFTIIKQFRSQTKNQIDLEEMRHELNILKKCQSPNVIRLIDSFTSDHVINMQLEYGETNFESIIRENHNLICKAWIPHYFYNIVNAVAHLHTLSIVHLDIKPENFVQVIGTLKLIDFGISREITGDNDYVDIKTCEGTLRYMSPEQIVMHQGLNVRRITVKSDVWSMGCILYRMVFGSLPFDSDSDENIIANIISCNYKISYAWNEKVVDIIKKCLEIDPKRRVASIQMLSESLFFTF
ncbi:MAG: hypothetical protein MHMPM18_003392, partial [Marteilia pararefringens]